MPVMPHNIEKSSFRRGYIGYGHGTFRITGSTGRWSVCQYRNGREATGIVPARYIGCFRTLADASIAITNAPAMPEVTI